MTTFHRFTLWCLALCLWGCASSKARHDVDRLKVGMTFNQVLATVHPDIGGYGNCLDGKASFHLSPNGEISMAGKTVPVDEFEKACGQEKQGWLVVLNYAGMPKRSFVKLTLSPAARLEKWEGPLAAD